MVREIDVQSLAGVHGAFVLDVREPFEYVMGHVPGAVLVPMAALRDHVARLPRDRTVHVICATGNRSAVAAAALSRAGLDAVSVAGGTSAWQRAGHPVVSGSRAA